MSENQSIKGRKVESLQVESISNKISSIRLSNLHVPSKNCSLLFSNTSMFNRAGNLGNEVDDALKFSII
jgi:hypothetical protein